MSPQHLAPRHVRPAPGQPTGAEHLDIPDLRLLPISALVLHEYADEKRVARLEARLRADGFLKNPPVVAPIPGTDRFVVLDGANRTSAVKRIGCPHILAQVVDYNSDHVTLCTWHHLITGREPVAFLEGIRGVADLVLQPASLEEARAGLTGRTALAYVVVPLATDEGPEVYTVHGAPGTAPDDHNSTALLNSMVDTYKSEPHVTIHRVNTDEMAELLPYYDEVSGLVVFPSYIPRDILRLAEAGSKVPTGITRHIIGHRALRVNVPMALLCSHVSLEEKSAWWHEQLKRKLASNEIRLYQESTYLFDE